MYIRIPRTSANWRPLLALLFGICPALAGTEPGSDLHWSTVVNKLDVMPNSIAAENPEGRTFNSFNQPSVNRHGLVVFRARSRGGPPLGPPTRGIYSRHMGLDDQPGPVHTLAGGNGRPSRGATAVPDPNNLTYPPDHLPTAFIEFPSIPRIAMDSNRIATRGNHQPVWRYEYLDPDTGEIAETRVGTTGLYVDHDAAQPEFGSLISAATKLGGVPGFESYAVPGLAAYRPFDVFPGSPAITDAGVVVFKGNYTDGVAKTGVFFRAVDATPGGGWAFTGLLANSDTPIPNRADCLQAVQDHFGSTAPPSAALDAQGRGQAVFVGLDFEAAPQCGGIYRAPLEPSPPLETLVALGADVPGVRGAVFTHLGEGLSFDGRFVGFWAAWGDVTRTLRLYCPTEGNRERIDFCNHRGEFDPVTGSMAGDVNSICDDSSDDSDSCYQEREIPRDQGMFVHDTITGRTYLLAGTGRGRFTDFLFWVYSGRVPGTGEAGGEEGTEEDGEPARWRSSAFNALSSRGAVVELAFKARTAAFNEQTRRYEDVVDGIYMMSAPGRSRLVTLVDTGMPGTRLDAHAVDATTLEPLPIVELGIERDGLRGRWLVLAASMGAESDAEESDSMAGIYLTRLPNWPYRR